MVSARPSRVNRSARAARSTPRATRFASAECRLSSVRTCGKVPAVISKKPPRCGANCNLGAPSFPPRRQRRPRPSPGSPPAVVQGRCRGDAGEMQGRCRVGAGEMQGRCRGYAGEVQGGTRLLDHAPQTGGHLAPRRELRRAPLLLPPSLRRRHPRSLGGWQVLYEVTSICLIEAQNLSSGASTCHIRKVGQTQCAMARLWKSARRPKSKSPRCYANCNLGAPDPDEPADSLPLPKAAVGRGSGRFAGSTRRWRSSCARSEQGLQTKDIVDLTRVKPYVKVPAVLCKSRRMTK